MLHECHIIDGAFTEVNGQRPSDISYTSSMISDSRMQYVTNFFEETTSQAEFHARYGELCLLKFADLFILWKPVWNPIGKRSAVEGGRTSSGTYMIVLAGSVDGRGAQLK